MSEALKNEIREAISPQAVALMIAHLLCVDGDGAPQREVRWFTDQLVDLCGGHDAVNTLYEEVGV